VYGVNARVSAEGEIGRTEVVEDSASGLPLAVVDFRNLGQGPVRPEGEIEIRTLSGEVVGVVAVPPFSVLPGRLRRTVVPIEVELAPGTYLAIPILDFGGAYLAGGQATFEVRTP
jgi:hypothetical protein